MDLAQQIRIGCSGWQYRHWGAAPKSPGTASSGAFYPAGLTQAGWFAHYARQFDTVEINNSFYRLPPPETFARWREQAPPHFLYAVKASRFLTHMKKLKDPDDPLRRLFEGAVQLGTRLGPVLYQLPPGWKVDTGRFAGFLEAIDRLPIGQLATDAGVAPRLPLRHVVEFREPSWYDDRIYELLQRHRVALCLHDMPGSATSKIVVGPFVYVRFHGWTKYAGRYEDARLDEWADWLAARIDGGLDVFAYFNNDVGGHAPRDAARLRDRLHARVDARSRPAKSWRTGGTRHAGDR
jgi:uncharacterized protein YecE (DUF72 family)